MPAHRKGAVRRGKQRYHRPYALYKEALKMPVPVINPPAGTFGAPQIDAQKTKRKFLDVSYASQSPNQLLDIYLPPEGSGPFPTLVYIHGGGFFMGDKRDAQLHCPYDGINRGYAVASVGYRLAAEAKYPAGLFDVKAAIRYLRANASKYMLDGDRLGVCGDSAGGFYAVMTAATQGNPAFEDLSMGNSCYSRGVKAVVSWFGVFDMAANLKDIKENGWENPVFKDIDLIWLGARCRDIEGLTRFANPLLYITSRFPPLYLLHGSEDHTVSVNQAYMMEEKVRAACGAERVKLEVMEGYEHGGLEPRWNDQANIDKVYAFFDKHLK
jgi:acetyl esterase/lipase